MEAFVGASFISMGFKLMATLHLALTKKLEHRPGGDCERRMRTLSRIAFQRNLTFPSGSKFLHDPYFSVRTPNETDNQ